MTNSLGVRKTSYGIMLISGSFRSKAGEFTKLSVKNACELVLCKKCVKKFLTPPENQR